MVTVSVVCLDSSLLHKTFVHLCCCAVGSKTWCGYVTMWLHQTYWCHACPLQIIQHYYTSVT